jgi:hypothetical protein
MIKNILAVTFAIAMAFATMIGIEYCSEKLFPPPVELNVLDNEMMRNYLANMPLGAYAMVTGGWIIGALFAGFLIAKITKSRKRWAPMTAGLLLTAASVANFVALPHPIWMVLIGVLIFIPMVLIGHHFVAKQ